MSPVPEHCIYGSLEEVSVYVTVNVRSEGHGVNSANTTHCGVRAIRHEDVTRRYISGEYCQREVLRGVQVPNR
jgi:hypothetical protein